MRYLDSDHPADELVDFGFDDVERRVLRSGVIEWGGPARCTEELAVAIGFDSVDDLFRQTRRLVDAIESSQPLTRRDWLRVVLATEFVFASDLVGSGLDWSFTTGLSDDQTLRALRSIQRKVTGELRRLIGDGFGTRPPRP